MTMYAQLSHPSELWGDRATGVTTIVVTDGSSWRVLGSDVRSQALAQRAEEVFRPGSDEQAALELLCRPVSMYTRIEQHQADAPVEEIVSQLVAVFRLPVCAPAST
jgi:hypothetical protein